MIYKLINSQTSELTKMGKRRRNNSYKWKIEKVMIKE